MAFVSASGSLRGSDTDFDRRGRLSCLPSDHSILKPRRTRRLWLATLNLKQDMLPSYLYGPIAIAKGNILAQKSGTLHSRPIPTCRCTGRASAISSERTSYSLDSAVTVLTSSSHVVQASQNPIRLDHVMAVSIIWSARLTFNYWRKGGYTVGSEDYRWPIVKERIGTAGMFLLNVTFISLGQNVSS